MFFFGRGAGGAETVKPGPDVTFRFEFPELPETLESLSSGKREPARLTATLPINYDSKGRFPVFIFLNGGDGGRGDGLQIPGRVVAPRDFICVSLPLFKRSYSEAEGGVISMEDFEVISRSYRAMLERLFEAAPNCQRERSALGGFSNGAHAVGVLLAGQDRFILDHFDSFFFVDGGFGPLAANVLSKLRMKDCRFLLIYGELPVGDPEREQNTFAVRALEMQGKTKQRDLKTIQMQIGRASCRER